MNHGADTETEVIQVSSFDGQTVWYDCNTKFLEVGNFLGGGAAGTVYECEHATTHEHYALKILNPIGYKMTTPALLRKCTVVVKGKVFNDASIDADAASEKEPTREHVWWLVNGSTKQFIGAYYSERQNCLKELSLSQCIHIYGTEPTGVGDDESGDNDATVEIVQQSGGPRVYVPCAPPKYADFVRRRVRIFREIRNMRKISTHVNVIRLEGVLELTQETKCTIFLIMELANGGELFDRIKIDCGTREGTAKFFFKQLLEGVRHCHEQGVCHRDLKPENLLLQDYPEGTTLKVADFGFSARFAMNDVPTSSDDWQQTQNQQAVIARYQQSVVHSGLTPTTSSMLEDSPLRVLKSVVGSPFYVAPEVLQARGYDGPRADVWSLGVILYAMLAGNLPFGQELGTCKRFRHFCKWVRDQMIKSARFWDDPNLEYPPWLFPAKFSIMAKGLIVSMLHPDPSCRITVLDAISHPLCARDVPAPAPASQLVPSTVEVTNMYKNVEVNGGTLRVPVDPNSMRIDNAALQHNNIVLAHALPVPRIDQDDHVQMSKELTRVDAMNEDEDEEGGVFRMEEDGEWDQEQQQQKGKAEDGKDSPIPTVAGEGMLPPFASAGYVFGSPPQTLSRHAAAPPLAPSLLNLPIIDDLVLGVDEIESGQEPPARGVTSSSSIDPAVANGTGSGSNATTNPPSFSDLVKRSTRFITAVPAAEVMEKVERVLEECKYQKTQTPVGLIGKIEVHWGDFRVEVWGLDVNGPPLCAIQLYQMPLDVASNTPLSPSRLTGIFGDSQTQQQFQPRQLFLVEFIRGQLEIFSHKRFYQYLRQRISDLVRRDFAGLQFESQSPMVDSNLIARLAGFKD